MLSRGIPRTLGVLTRMPAQLACPADGRRGPAAGWIVVQGPPSAQAETRGFVTREM